MRSITAGGDTAEGMPEKTRIQVAPGFGSIVVAFYDHRRFESGLNLERNSHWQFDNQIFREFVSK